MITPLWSVSYVCGHVYNGDLPVGSDLPDFESDPRPYIFRLFTRVDEEQIKGPKRLREACPIKGQLPGGKSF